MKELPEKFRAEIADRYVIERELGRGGMATVYLADDRKHRRKVAIKVLRTQLDGDRFLREIEILAGLQHPHIVPLLDSGTADATPFYVMPFVDGESLRSRLSRGPLSLPEAIDFSRHIARALDYAHRRGLLHRDIKPENVLLYEGHALVLDFGIARAISQARDDRLTATGHVVGTPVYMSPEQFSGDTDIDARSDIFALGCVMFEMLAGRPPFGATSGQLFARLTAPAPSLRAIGVSVPHDVQAIIDRALARDPDSRFQSAGALAEALELPSPRSGAGESGSLWRRHRGQRSSPVRAWS